MTTEREKVKESLETVGLPGKYLTLQKGVEHLRDAVVQKTIDDAAFRAAIDVLKPAIIEFYDKKFKSKKVRYPEYFIYEHPGGELPVESEKRLAGLIRSHKGSWRPYNCNTMVGDLFVMHTGLKFATLDHLKTLIESNRYNGRVIINFEIEVVRNLNYGMDFLKYQSHNRLWPVVSVSIGLVALFSFIIQCSIESMSMPASGIPLWNADGTASAEFHKTMNDIRSFCQMSSDPRVAAMGEHIIAKMKVTQNILSQLF